MRHLKAHRKLGRTMEHRKSLLKSLATSLVNSPNDYIITTLPKAKELRSFIEKAITLARRAQHLSGDNVKANEVHLRRVAATYFHAGNQGYKFENSKFGKPKPERTTGVKALKRLFDELGPRYKDRNGGYTRVIKIGHRKGDGAETAVIELVDNVREIAAKAEAK